MEVSLTAPVFRGIFGRAVRVIQTAFEKLWRSPHKRRSLLVKEMAGLGERRFVAVVKFERQRFLIGASGASVTLLAHLPEEEATENDPK
jgi:flagellar biogenesis protein FliO